MAKKLNTPGMAATENIQKASPDPAKASSPANVKTTFGTPKNQ